MKYIITRIDYDHVKAEVQGYYPLKGTFEGFFKDLRSYVNRPAFVKSLEYKNHTINMEKLDPEYGFIYTDSYVLDGLLENDARFMEYLEAFLADYESKKESLAANVENVIKGRNFRMEVLRTATRIYINYCEKGEIGTIDNPEIAKNVVQMFKRNDPRVYTNFSYTMEGDIVVRPQFEFKTSNVRRMKVATGVSGVATGVLALTSLALSNPVTALTGVATGIGCYCANKKKNELNDAEAKKVLTELGKIYEEMYPSVDEDKEDVHKLTK